MIELLRENRVVPCPRSGLRPGDVFRERGGELRLVLADGWSDPWPEGLRRVLEGMKSVVYSAIYIGLEGEGFRIHFAEHALLPAFETEVRALVDNYLPGCPLALTAAGGRVVPFEPSWVL